MKKLDNVEVKEMIEKIQNQFSAKIDFTGYVLYETDKGKLYLCTSEFESIEKELRANTTSFGIYFASIDEKGSIRLSIEGSQIIFPHTKHNIFYANEKQVEKWIRGFEIENLEGKTELTPNFVLIADKEGDCFGCGKFTGSKILNFVKKTRRVLNLKEP